MIVRTTRFGDVDIAEDRVITFPKGLLGFADCKRYCLFEPSEDACFYWLQSLDEPSLAFVVTDPSLFFPEYTVPIRPEQMKDLGLNNLDDAQVFVIVNKVGQALTGNLQGPLVINTGGATGCPPTAEQFVLAERRWTTRHTLVEIEPKQAHPNPVPLVAMSA